MGVIMKAATTGEQQDFDRDQTLMLFGEPTRWRMVGELAKGEALPVQELAQRLRCKPANISKHLAVLRKHGIVLPHYGTCYRLAPAFMPKPGENVLDLGHCTMKLDTPP